MVTAVTIVYFQIFIFKYTPSKSALTHRSIKTT